MLASHEGPRQLSKSQKMSVGPLQIIKKTICIGHVVLWGLAV